MKIKEEVVQIYRRKKKESANDGGTNYSIVAIAIEIRYLIYNCK